ncbi:MAG: T9SS C-terminal target domain-containing protein [Balneola sp.]|nr:MAG: T9SS C-terminal target domain-containing protein [Balneola sp.]
MKRTVLAITISIIFTSFAWSQSDNRISYNDQELWLNGGNIAWVNFASDVGPGNTALDDFEAMFQQVQENGGNAMRFWVHITGGTTPTWSGNNVTGLGDGTIEDLENILDLAWENNVSMILCLWSFDMLRIENGTTITDRAKALLEDSTLTEVYIENALVPMVEALGDHPALLAWEIFNEPEGMSNEFGWDFNRHVPMSAIQRFVNQTAGAIHRTDPDALVSNGSWSFHSLATTNSSVSKNYYSDEELIAAGGDSLGILDFYMVHYYDWAGTALSPFHHDKSSWGLDKPVVVGEFGVPEDDLFGVPQEDMYETLFQRGYAGALVWQWVDWYQNRGNYGPSWLRALDQMHYMDSLYTSEVRIFSVIPSIRKFEASLGEIEEGGQSQLSWDVLNTVEVTINGEVVDSVGSMIVAPTETTEYELIGTGAEGDKDSAYVTIQVLPAGLINRALNKPSRASTFETCCGTPLVSSFAFDGDENTRWSSAWSDGTGTTEIDPNTDKDPDSEWIDVDLEAAHEVGSVLFNWEAAYSTNYDIQTSFDGINWTTVYSENSSDGGIDSIAFDTPKLARFVRMQGDARSLEFGHSMWEFEVRGAVSITQPPVVEISSPENGKGIPVGGSTTIVVEAEDETEDITHVAFFLNGDSVGVDNTAPYSLVLSDIEEGEHEIYVKARDEEGFVVQSESITIEGRTDIFLLRLEAETASISGETTRQFDRPGASNNASVAMEGSGSITWNNLNLPEGDEYQMTVRYYLPYGYKEQKFAINGELVDTLIFNEPINVWQDLTTVQTFDEVIESISIDHFWGWMDFDYLEIVIEGVTVDTETELEIPTQAKLFQNYPNPFNPTTNISYSLPALSRVNLKIYNALGQEVATLVDAQQSSGSHTITWNAADAATGVYFYQLIVGNEILTRKMILIK